MPAGSNKKREREYEELKREFKKEGRYRGRQEEVAARIVNKQRAQMSETQGARRADRSGTSPDRGLPIKDYDHQTISTIAKKLPRLSPQEMRELRSYEQKHKNRATLLSKMGQSDGRARSAANSSRRSAGTGSSRGTTRSAAGSSRTSRSTTRSAGASRTSRSTTRSNAGTSRGVRSASGRRTSSGRNSRSGAAGTARRSSTRTSARPATREGSGERTRRASSRTGASQTGATRSTPTRRSSGDRGPGQAGGGRSGASQTTTDHDQIRRWAEERGAQPATVRGTGRGDEAGVLRLDFPGYGGTDRLEPLPWEEWFQKFDEKGLQFLYQEKLKSGRPSNFFKLIEPEGRR